jgi:hypothetical protein
VVSLPPRPSQDHIVEYRASNPQSQDAIVAFKTSVAAIADEYFNSADVTEAAASLAELGTPLYTHYAVKKLITMAMDRKTRECEMAARLLSGAPSIPDPLRSVRETQ